MIIDPTLRGRTLEVVGPENLTLNQLAAQLQQISGPEATIRHIPRPALRTMAKVMARINPALARQGAAAVVIGYDGHEHRFGLPRGATALRRYSSERVGDADLSHR